MTERDLLVFARVYGAKNFVSKRTMESGQRVQTLRQKKEELEDRMRVARKKYREDVFSFGYAIYNNRLGQSDINDTINALFNFKNSITVLEFELKQTTEAYTDALALFSANMEQEGVTAALEQAAQAGKDGGE